MAKGGEKGMINRVLLYLGALLTTLWGIAHLFPTRSVVEGFGDISSDNKRIITMEWIVEGVCLIFVGVLVAAVTTVDATGLVSRTVYWICIAALNALSVVSLFTGFRISYLPFKLCPVIFTGSSLLILLGTIL
jgi:hypothetical protein